MQRMTPEKIKELCRLLEFRDSLKIWLETPVGKRKPAIFASDKGRSLSFYMLEHEFPKLLEVELVTQLLNVVELAAKDGGVYFD